MIAIQPKLLPNEKLQIHSWFVVNIKKQQYYCISRNVLTAWGDLTKYFCPLMQVFLKLSPSTHVSTIQFNVLFLLNLIWWLWLRGFEVSIIASIMQRSSSLNIAFPGFGAKIQIRYFRLNINIFFIISILLHLFHKKVALIKTTQKKCYPISKLLWSWLEVLKQKKCICYFSQLASSSVSSATTE